MSHEVEQNKGYRDRETSVKRYDEQFISQVPDECRSPTYGGTSCVVGVRKDAQTKDRRRR